jgi:hypothetical protein
MFHYFFVNPIEPNPTRPVPKIFGFHCVRGTQMFGLKKMGFRMDLDGKPKKIQKSMKSKIQTQIQNPIFFLDF